MKNKIKVFRADKDWSQQELADAVGVSRQTINAIEQGKYAPSLPLALALAKTFQTPVEQLFSME
ncbi:MAG: helix-turn-helix transcriptional regulator [Schleiferiaceae bacterium]|jgi:putative transcriptional regulator|nr:helix-turn-helix transcriptional regulator [Schleiferiaceae bacterium]MDP4627882.1 helix-turn-helix transcriptional regulator [Schleiferiaceae bacterium]MDP4727558.1 helix-turn-helix transcriptional regulator [Schleiferiaceae bacterium]MDP4750123.1 helix-turn-helix transcriptional regulator [Schleiferiaceae bacterium]MDP4859423.1 helix-turn-helix transcriptional regulator [Schleiferiaceae bacterium]